MLQPRSIQSSLGLRDKILSFDFWQYATNNEWDKVYNELMDFRDKSKSINKRHKKV